MRPIDVLLERRVVEESARLLKIEAAEAARSEKAQAVKLAEKAAKAAAPKKPQGGKRPGAGRRPDFLKRSGLAPLTSHVIMSHFDIVKIWGSLLNSPSHDVRLRAISYLTDRTLGKTGDRPTSGEMATRVTVEFCAANDGKFLLNEGPMLQGETIEAAPAPEPIPEAAPEPVPQRQPRPPLAIVSGLQCPRHGEYTLPGNARGGTCPSCIVRERKRKGNFSA